MIIVVGLVIAFILLLIFNRPASARGCLWRQDLRRGKSAWRCAACGAELFTTDGRAPRTCRRNAPPGASGGSL